MIAILKIVLNAASDKPMYEQIKSYIREAVLSGDIPDKTMLPSVRQLAAELHVSAITTKRAYSDLEQEGLIFTSQGKGTFINAPDAQALTRKFRQKKLEEFAEYAQRLLDEGFSKGELYNEINKLSGDPTV
ncbi:MAG: GntR family transcriptional regulator [Oscillospiraceae bacterium]|nr:GntR family transcriptional regulator [Oscillospiraceae bacterium]